jgi:hypothetical protein
MFLETEETCSLLSNEMKLIKSAKAAFQLWAWALLTEGKTGNFTFTFVEQIYLNQRYLWWYCSQPAATIHRYVTLVRRKGFSRKIFYICLLTDFLAAVSLLGISPKCISIEIQSATKLTDQSMKSICFSFVLYWIRNPCLKNLFYSVNPVNMRNPPGFSLLLYPPQ